MHQQENLEWTKLLLEQIFQVTGVAGIRRICRSRQFGSDPSDRGRMFRVYLLPIAAQDKIRETIRQSEAIGRIQAVPDADQSSGWPLLCMRFPDPRIEVLPYTPPAEGALQADDEGDDD